MVEAVIDHLWQSSLCALVAVILTLALRKSGANIRFLVWLAASAKFLLPFSLLVWIGAQLRWQVAPLLRSGSELELAIDRLVQPAAAVSSNFAATPFVRVVDQAGSGWTPVLAIWLMGAFALCCWRLYQWLYLRAITDASSPLDIDAPIPVCEARNALEPGVFGIVSPTLLLPVGLADEISPAQLSAVLDHELCHWRRNDNLTAALHMVVETLFWFYPLVWWLGGRLLVERERACDEAVVQSGRDRQVYAEGILKVCQRYVERPLCSAGVSGGNLRKRIEEIMTNPTLVKLSVTKKCLLAAAAFVTIAAPVFVGLGSGAGVALAADGKSTEMTHYRSSEWKFELDVPKKWIVMPPVSSNSQNEVIRFTSRDDGTHTLIVFRNPRDPQEKLDTAVAGTRERLAKNGFSNFVVGETTIGARKALMLDFNRLQPDGVTVWYCREYFVADGSLGYVLGFGTTNHDAISDLYDRMANSFAFDAI